MSLLLRWLLDATVQPSCARRHADGVKTDPGGGGGAAAHYNTHLYLLDPNPAYDPKRFLLRRMFFINEDKTMYVSVGYYPARDYQTLVEFGAMRRGGSKCLILSDEQVAALAYCLPAIRDSMCVGEDRVFIKCEGGNFGLHTPKKHGSARLFVGTENISLTQPDMDYLVRVFQIL